MNKILNLKEVTTNSIKEFRGKNNDYNITLIYSNYYTNKIEIILEPINTPPIKIDFESRIREEKTKNQSYDEIIFDRHVYLNNIDVIARLTNTRAREIFKYLNSNNIILKISDNTLKITCEYKNPLSLLFNNFLIIERSINNLLELGEMIYVKPENDVKLIYKNINNEKNINIQIMNMTILSKTKENHNNFYYEIIKNGNYILKSFASIGLKKNVIENLEILINSYNSSAQLFAINYLIENYKDFPQSINLLSKSLYKVIDINLLLKILNSLFKIKNKMSYLQILNYIKERDKNLQFLIDNESGKYEEYIIIKLNIIKNFGMQKFTNSINWLASNLKNRNLEILFASINALSKIGNSRAVEYLLPLTKGFHSSEVKMTAQDAINNIQKNIPKDQQGDLTLAEIENTGQLSIENGDGGNLSLNDDKIDV
jgi:hypothetical protein